MVQKNQTKECPSCAMEVGEKEEFCPICEFHFPKRNPLYQWVAIILALFFLLMFIL
jgi:RNA polymerase subunit RPABC4/transcription elongation factor Spt4